MLDLSSHAVVITGATGNLGNTVVRAFLEAGTLEKQLPLLIEGLHSEDALVRQTCAIRLGCIGEALTSKRGCPRG